MKYNLTKIQWSLFSFVWFFTSGVFCETQYCSGYDKAERNSIYGDALSDPVNCRSREGKAYPSEELRRMYPQLKRFYQGNSRESRTMFSNKVQRPEMTKEELMNFHIMASQGRIDEISSKIRSKRQAGEENKNSTKGNDTDTTDITDTNLSYQPQTCVPDSEITPARLCKSTFNTTAPMYGVSLTSGEHVTIVQIFPDLLQQVVYEMCDAKECDVLHGECVQTYVPYLFLVIPLGPVTLTGQDYVLVESGCTCRPKFSRPGTGPNPASVIPSF